jgi:hypothetical protein
MVESLHEAVHADPGPRPGTRGTVCVRSGGRIDAYSDWPLAPGVWQPPAQATLAAERKDAGGPGQAQSRVREAQPLQRGAGAHCSRSLWRC